LYIIITNMSIDPSREQNFIETKMIIQEFYDDSTVFIVGSAPFGKLWFDQDKINKQYEAVCESWSSEYGNGETNHCKKPRIISVLIDEEDPMFDQYRDTIREAQARKKLAYEIEFQQKLIASMKASAEASLENDTDSVPMANITDLDANVVISPPSPPVIKEKKPRIKKNVAKDEPKVQVDTTENIELCVVVEKKPTKPRQKKTPTPTPTTESTSNIESDVATKPTKSKAGTKH
jgi:hypothetical protein